MPTASSTDIAPIDVLDDEPRARPRRMASTDATKARKAGAGSRVGRASTKATPHPDPASKSGPRTSKSDAVAGAVTANLPKHRTSSVLGEEFGVDDHTGPFSGPLPDSRSSRRSESRHRQEGRFCRAHRRSALTDPYQAREDAGRPDA